MAKAAVTFIMIHIMGLTLLYLLVEPLSVDAMLVAGALFAMSAWGLVTSVKNSSRSSRTVRAESEGRLHMSAPLPRGARRS